MRRLLLTALFTAGSAFAQNPLATAKKVYIDPALSADADLAKMVREKLTFSLVTHTKLNVVDTPELADITLSGVTRSEELSHYAAVGTVGSGGRYLKATLVLRLTDTRSKAILWMFDSDIAKCRSGDKTLSNCAAKDIAKSIEAAKKANKR